eukprot:6063941-Pleurochrysis_carterae.AAC.1
MAQAARPRDVPAAASPPLHAPIRSLTRVAHPQRRGGSLAGGFSPHEAVGLRGKQGDDVL